MPVTLDKLEHWILSPKETERLEFKAAELKYSEDKLCGYCCAIANEGGGDLILGVTDKMPRQVKGSRAFEGTSNPQLRVKEALNLKVGLTELNHENGRVLVFEIPSRHKGVPIEYEGRYLMRAGESLVGMTPDELKNIFAELDDPEPPFDERIAKADLTATEVVSLLDTQQYFLLRKLPLPIDTANQVVRLENDDLVIRDKESGLFSIRNAGALLLARNLREFGSLRYKAPRVVVYGGVSKTDQKRDQEGALGFAIGFKRLLRYVMDQIPENIVFEEGVRIKTPIYPSVAVREIVANAIIHQDFESDSGRVTIEIYADRFEVKNPGEAVLHPDRFIDSNRSRNKLLARTMYMLGLCEELGSGIDKVIESIELNELPPLKVFSGVDTTSVCLRKHIGMSQYTQDQKTEACFQHCAFRHATGQATTNESVRGRFNLKSNQTAMASKILKECMEEGRIKPSDPDQKSRKFTSYIPFYA